MLESSRWAHKELAADICHRRGESLKAAFGISGISLSNDGTCTRMKHCCFLLGNLHIFAVGIFGVYTIKRWTMWTQNYVGSACCPAKRWWVMSSFCSDVSGQPCVSVWIMSDWGQKLTSKAERSLWRGIQKCTVNRLEWRVGALSDCVCYTQTQTEQNAEQTRSIVFYYISTLLQTFTHPCC